MPKDGRFAIFLTSPQTSFVKLLSTFKRACLKESLKSIRILSCGSTIRVFEIRHLARFIFLDSDFFHHFLFPHAMADE